MKIAEKMVPEFLTGGGEMGERIRNFDWSKTSLGNPGQWPQGLKTCVRIMLSSPQPIWIGWGQDLTKLYNDAYIDIVRGKHPQALGQPSSVVWKDIWKDIEPLLTKAMVKDEGTYVESQLLIMERSGFPEETYYTFSYTPVLGDNGKPAGIICYNTADTERIINERSMKTLQHLDSLAHKKNEQEIYEEAARALESNPQDFPFAIIYKLDSEGKSAEMIAAAGFKKNETKLPSTIDLEDPEQKNIAKAAIQNTIVVAPNNIRSKSIPKGAWDVIPHQLIQVPVKSTNKKLPLAILTIGLNPYRKFDDVYRNFVQLIADQVSLGITNVLAYEEERKRAKALEELDKAKTLFFSNISHEFRTPITLMLGPLEELLNKSTPDFNSNDKQNLEVTHRNTLRLLKLVNSLLDFSRIESGRQQATYVLTDICSFTKNLASNFRSVIEKAGLQFIVDTDSFIQPLYVDREMWEKIVFNLLSNAFKYTLEGKVSISLSVDNSQALLTVEDTGVGVPEKELPNMFERFHRVQSTAGRTYEGTGIGLSLVKELVHLHKGTISVESEEGKGSRFMVRIPFGKEHLPLTQIHETDHSFDEIISNVYVEEASTLLDAELDKVRIEHTGPGKKEKDAPTVLIVDDNADMRHHIESLIGKKYNTITASNGMDALHKINESMPAVVLSDIMMPVMDGLQLLKELRTNPKTVNIPVILITARAGEESRIEGYETGADDYLVKPFSSNELLARIKAQIRVATTRKKIADSEKQFRNVLEQSPSIFVILKGPEMRISFANEHALRSWARTKDIIGKTLLEALPEIRDQAFPKLLQHVYETGETYYAKEEKAVLIKDGIAQDLYYEYVYQPIYENDKTITGITIMASEITEQVRARKKIEESEERFRTLTETLPQLVWITDAKGQQQFASGRWMEYSGILPTGEDSWAAIVHKEDMDNILDAWTYALQTGKNYTVDVRLKSMTGGYRWHYGQGEPLRNEAGEITNWMGSFTDIHDQKLFAENLEMLVQERTSELRDKNIALENSESFLQQVLDSSVEFIAVLDRDLRYITVNKKGEEIFGLSRKDIFGKHIFDITPKIKDTEQYRAVLTAMGGETVYLDKRQALSVPDYYVDTYFIPLRIRNRVEGVIIMARNVKDTVHAEGTPEEKDKSLSQKKSRRQKPVLK